MKIKVTNRNIHFEPGDEVEEGELDELADETAYTVEGAQFSKEYRMGRWDGRVELLQYRRGRWKAPVGLLEDVFERFPRCEVEDARRQPGVQASLCLDPSVIPKLRPYQQEALEAVLEDRGILTGKGLLRLPTRSGKTVIAAGIIAKHGGRAVFFVNSQMLLEQTVRFFRKVIQGEAPDGSQLVAQYGGGVNEIGWITVASVQSVTAHLDRPEMKGLLGAVDLAFFDECFVAGTPIQTPEGVRPIESIAIGDSVLAWDPESGFVVEKVTELHRRTSSNLWRVRVDGEDFVVTGEHPWLSSRGWAATRDLQPGCKVVRLQNGVKLGSVEEVERLPGVDTPVFNFGVSRVHTYVVGESGVVVHNCHHLEADLWRKTMLLCDARYKIGLSATIYLDRLRHATRGTIWLVGATGPVLYELEPSDLIEQGWLCRPVITFLTTPDLPWEIGSDAYATVYKAGVVEHEERNKLIAKVAKREVDRGNRVLVTARQLNHVDRIKRRLKALGLSVAVLTGKTPAKERKRLCERVKRKEDDVLVGTVFTEAVDLPFLECVIIGDAGASRIAALQRLRNLTPVGENDKPLLEPMKKASKVPVYDFADFDHKILRRHTKERLAVYKSHRAFMIRWEDS